jgi:hypothetical protein
VLGRVCLPGDTLATTAAGVIPYRSGLVTLDLLGLNAPDLSRFRRRDSRRPGHRFLLSEDWLEAARPHVLLGHPMVRPSTKHLGLSLDLRPEWRDRILARYTLVGFTLEGTPVRYAGCTLRSDVTDRVLAAAARLDRETWQVRSPESGP